MKAITNEVRLTEPQVRFIRNKSEAEELEKQLKRDFPNKRMIEL